MNVQWTFESEQRGLRQGQSFEERRNWVTESPNLGGVTRKRKYVYDEKKTDVTGRHGHPAGSGIG